MRLIDADELKAAHGMKDDCADCDKELRGKSRSCEFDRIYSLMDFCGWVDDASTIEPERKRGKWIYGEHDCQDGWFCSECNGFIPWDYDYYGLDNIDFIKDFKTCPHCDAVMVSYTGKREGEQDVGHKVL